MVYNLKHVRVAEDGELEGIKDLNRNAGVFVRRNYNEDPTRPFKYGVEGVFVKEKEVKASASNKVSTDKRSEKEIIISRKTKARKESNKKCYVEDIEEELAKEPCFEIVEDKKAGTIKVLEDGEVAAEVFSYNSKDEKYAAWANPDFVL